MSEPTLPHPPAQARILVVDDHPNTATTLARAISQLGPGVDVISATSGKGALESVTEAAVDVLITDMMMPDMNGLELIEKLRSHPAGRPTHTILVTAYDVPGLRESARRLKVNDVLIKPIRPERLCLIVREALESMGRSQVSAPAPGPQKSFKILIADDNPDNVSLLSRSLQNEGYALVTAYDGVQALEKTRSEMPDLVLLDVNMPRMDGFKVLQEVRADPAIEFIPVIILTAARVGPGDVQSGLNLGADDYVTKPFDRRELLARIRTKLRVKEAEDAIRQRNKALGVLPEIGKEISARLDIQDLAEVVVRRTVETLGAMLGQIMIFGPAGVLQKSHRISATGQPVPDLKPAVLVELLNEIRESQQGVMIADVHEDPRWQSTPGDPTRSLAIAPLLGRRELIGVILLTHETAGYFNVEHQLLLQAIAGQAAIAIENARLYSDIAMAHERARTEGIGSRTSAAWLELRKSIAMISLSSQLLAQAGPLNERQLELSAEIQDAITSLTGLVRRALNGAPTPEGALQWALLDAKSLVEECVEGFRPEAAAKNLRLIVKETDGNPQFPGDRGQLQEALKTLLGRAVRITPAQGSVEVSAEAHGHQLTLSIADSGVAIAPEDLPVVFEEIRSLYPMAGADSEDGASGLAAVKAIVERHGGRIDVRSAVGEGTCFTFDLPLAVASSNLQPQPGKPRIQKGEKYVRKPKL